MTATLDAIRRQRARREIQAPTDSAVMGDQGTDLPVDAHGRTASPEQHTARRRLLDRVLATLSRLPERRRRAVALHLQGFTHREIADLLDWTEHKARNLVHRGLKELRAELRREGIDYEDR